MTYQVDFTPVQGVPSITGFLGFVFCVVSGSILETGSVTCHVLGTYAQVIRICCFWWA